MGASRDVLMPQTRDAGSADPTGSNICNEVHRVRGHSRPGDAHACRRPPLSRYPANHHCVMREPCASRNARATAVRPLLLRPLVQSKRNPSIGMTLHSWLLSSAARCSPQSPASPPLRLPPSLWVLAAHGVPAGAWTPLRCYLDVLRTLPRFSKVSLRMQVCILLRLPCSTSSGFTSLRITASRGLQLGFSLVLI